MDTIYNYIANHEEHLLIFDVENSLKITFICYYWHLLLFLLLFLSLNMRKIWNTHQEQTLDFMVYHQINVWEHHRAHYWIAYTVIHVSAGHVLYVSVPNPLIIHNLNRFTLLKANSPTVTTSHAYDECIDAVLRMPFNIWIVFSHLIHRCYIVCTHNTKYKTIYNTTSARYIFCDLIIFRLWSRYFFIPNRIIAQ